MDALRVGLLVALAAALNGPSLQQRQVPSPQPVIASGTTAVVVDAVVVDAKGNPVRDLRKEDFHLFEDGVEQDIGDLTFVGNPAPAANPVRVSPELAETPKAGGVDSGGERGEHANARLPGSTFMALVFDRLSHEGRALAYKGALACVDTLAADDYVGVFLADLSLTTIQGYTNDREKLRAAVTEAARRATTRFDDFTTNQSHSGSRHPAEPWVASAESSGRPVDTRFLPFGGVVAYATRNSAEMLEHDQQGYAITDALLAIATGLGHAPGRKSVMFFAEGVAIPDNVLPRFRDVVTTANRANVSVYTIDAAGLRVHSKEAETGRAVRGVGAASMSIGRDGSSGNHLGLMEVNEDTLRRSPRVSLTLLAEQTGGFLVENTNDLGKAAERIQRDRSSYYLLTYVPKNTNFDGKWRNVTVKVPARKVTVRARSGYLAVRSAGALPLKSYEGPALAALERIPLPAELSVRGGAFVFPQPDAANPRMVVLVATDGDALAVATDRSKASAHTDFTILARLKDATGEVVRKGSQQYRLSADMRGEVLFFRSPALPAGSYTLEYVVHDALGQRAGAGTAPVIVQEKRAGQPQVSSLLIVRRTERVPATERDANNPLYYGDLLLYPNLGEPISKRQTPTLTFAFNVVAGSAPAHASLALQQGERTLGETALPLATADAQGRIWHVSQLPLTSLTPGEYTLLVTITAGADTETRRTTFRVIE
jgi:VWFA-related protein